MMQLWKPAWAWMINKELKTPSMTAEALPVTNGNTANGTMATVTILSPVQWSPDQILEPQRLQIEDGGVDLAQDQIGSEGEYTDLGCRLCLNILTAEQELSLNKVLRCGQAFRWKQINDVWSCSLFNRVLFVKQDDKYLHYASLFQAQPKVDDTEAVVRDYFQLEVQLLQLYDQWAKADPKFVKTSSGFNGIRMLRQDPWENLVSFICSQNNNVKRISKMCNSLCENFGNYILTHQGIDYYSFPQASQLMDSSMEQQLRALGFGYRAKYIQKTSQMVFESGIDLLALRDKDYEECFEILNGFQGVGPKVADCVCLMSLDKTDVVPVDTHVFTFAKRDYKFKSSTKVLNRQLYEEIRGFFKILWGEYAGWAHSVLFAADLKDLNNGVNLVTTGTVAGPVAGEVAGEVVVHKVLKAETDAKNSRRIKAQVTAIKQES